MLWRFLRDESAASAAEYALLLAVLAGAIVLGALTLANSIDGAMRSCAASIDGHSAPDPDNSSSSGGAEPTPPTETPAPAPSGGPPGASPPGGGKPANPGKPADPGKPSNPGCPNDKNKHCG